MVLWGIGEDLSREACSEEVFRICKENGIRSYNKGENSMPRWSKQHARYRYLERAHNKSSNHKPELENDQRCGCFYCLKIFNPVEIKEWIVDEISIDWQGTAICPYCGVDSVIGESSGFPITYEFLKEMQGCWFGKDDSR